MTDLPASIEAYLTDAGFSATEILVLKKLLEGEALTLRELAAKTGKSTGVLDLAVKKLLQRRIINREMVNDSPKVLLKSLNAVVQWMQDDTEQQLKAIKSRAQDFESFINSLERESKRPEMEHFEGEEGIKKAYLKLLELNVKEFLHERPVTTKEEEDPLREFRVQYFRARHKRGVFSRVLAPEHSLGRRFQSRDPFEYRETQLVPDAVFPITFEKIIAGETVACFNHAEQRACILKYSELALSERTVFELLWRRAKEPASQPQTVAVTLPQPPQPLISLSTRSLSSLREFLLSRKSVTLFTVCAVLAGAITFGLWRHTYNLNRDRVKERAMAIAATVAMEFDVRDIDQLHTKEDVKKPEFMKLVEHLREIKTRNENIRFVYIDRPTEAKDALWEVVADADYGTPDDDFNGDGIIQDFEQLTMPGQVYPHVDPLFQERLQKPAADFLSDEWGEYCDASAPIFDSEGKGVAALFVDIDMKEVHDLTNGSFRIAYSFISLFILFVLVRLAAFNRPLFFELLKILRSKTVLSVLGVYAVIAMGVTYGMYRYSYNLSLQRVRGQVMAIAATAAPEFDTDDLDQLHTWRDAEKPVYEKVVMQLRDIRQRNPKVKYVYIMRPTDDPYFYQFIADADSLNIRSFSDLTGDGLRNDITPPGYSYYDYEGIESSSFRALFKPDADNQIAFDIWGTWISGHAPIRDIGGKTVAIIGVDIDVKEIEDLAKKSFSPVLFFFGFFALFILIRLVVFKSS